MKTNMTNVDFDVLVSEYYEALYRFAFSLTRVEMEAEDLTQQTFYVWATKGHQLREVSKVKSWLFTTLHRTFLASRRRQSRFPHHELNECEDELTVENTEGSNQSDCGEVLKALAQIDENYRATIALFYLEDISFKEIAEVLQIPIGTVKSRLSRGLGQLRKALEAAPLECTASSTKRKSSAPSHSAGSLEVQQSKNRCLPRWAR